MVGNKGGRGVVGNKGGRGVVGNKGNTTVGQAKVNAAEKRKSFKGNTETGQSKRIAGKRSGLIRRAKQALLVKKRWLDNILGGEELRRAGKALQRADSDASQLVVAAHAGDASLQRVLKTGEFLQQVRDLVWDLDRYSKESRCDVGERHLARMPRPLPPPLCSSSCHG